MNLKESVIVITGSTRGFGKAVASALLAKGAKVVICGRKQESVEAAIGQLASMGTVNGLACDVSRGEQVYALAKFTLDKFGRLDAWINNAGISSTAAGGVLDFAPQTAEEIFRANCTGTLHGTQTAVAVMKRQGGGTIVNIYGRGSDLRPATPNGLYGASKAWITSFTRTAAAEYKHLPVRFIGFSPGMMNTDMLKVHQVIGEVVAEQMRSFPMVLKALSNPPEVPAAELVHLLEVNKKRFVEYRFMRGLRLLKMIANLTWMGMNKKARPPEEEFEIIPAFEPRLE